jgi:nucleoid DNA-binding protein
MYLKKEQIAELASKLELSSIDILDVEEHFFKSLKNYMSMSVIPIIRIRNFGTFKPHYNKIKHSILACIKNIRAGEHVEINKEKIRNLWIARNTLIKHKQTRYYG